MDLSTITTFSTNFLIEDFKKKFKGVHYEWTRSGFEYERYIRVELPEGCSFPILFGATGATHIGFRGCYEWEKQLGYNSGTERKTEPACLVLLIENMPIRGTEMRLKNLEQFREVFKIVIHGNNAVDYMGIIRELKAIVKEILEKQPEAFV